MQGVWLIGWQELITKNRAFTRFRLNHGNFWHLTVQPNVFWSLMATQVTSISRLSNMLVIMVLLFSSFLLIRHTDFNPSTSTASFPLARDTVYTSINGSTNRLVKPVCQNVLFLKFFGQLGMMHSLQRTFKEAFEKQGFSHLHLQLYLMLSPADQRLLLTMKTNQ